MRTITAIAKYSDEEIKKLEGYFIKDHHYDQVIDYDCDAYKEDGTPLFFFRKNVIPSKNPNLGTRLNPTPTRRGPTPDMDADIGLFENTARASDFANEGCTILPALSFAYC